MTSHLFSMAVASGRTVNQEKGVAMGLETASIWGLQFVAVLIALVSAVIAVIAVLLTRSETQKQRALRAEAVRLQLDGQSLGWGNTSIDVLNRAAMFARTRKHQANDAGFLQQRVNMMLAISSLLERGRLLFPNVESDTGAADPTRPYRGSEPPILEALLLAYHELDALTRQGGPTADNSADFIDDCRRLLVSELNAYSDPVRREAITNRYDEQNINERRDALARAKTLKTLLKSRRPGINLSHRKETVQ